MFAASRLSSEANECYDGCGVAFKVTSQAAVAADPRKSSFYNPAFGQDLEAGSTSTLHDAQTAMRLSAGVTCTG